MSKRHLPAESATGDVPVVGRRTLIAGAVGAVGTAVAIGSPTASALAKAAGTGAHYFQHGVASGDPLPTAVVLWTRVTPTAEATPGSGRGPRVTVGWEIATDPDFSHVVRRGTASTGPARDHTVKLDAVGLRPNRWYWYRFSFGGTTSPVGRTRTAPRRQVTPTHLRWGVVSCANLQAGWFGAYRGLADRDDLHAIVHLGDYLYEYAPGEYGMGSDNVDIRKHDPAHEMVTRSDYRRRHAQYKQDRDLQRLHGKYPFITTWDDHEVANDAWRDGAENHSPNEGRYATRKAIAHAVYDEWMPSRLGGSTRLGDGTRLFRRLKFGTLAELSMLDLRSYRSQQVANQADAAGIADPDRTITGKRQLAWLKRSLTRTVTWKVIGNPVMIAPVRFGALPADQLGPLQQFLDLGVPTDGVAYNVDQWDGYTADRRELFSHLRDEHIDNAVFITGDIHSGWAAELPIDAGSYPVTGDSVGVEFVCSSVTSNNLKDITGTPAHTTSTVIEAAIMAANQHVKYLNFDDHGFCVLDLNSERAQMDWFIISDRSDPKATITWTQSWQTAAGSRKLTAVTAPVS